MKERPILFSGEMVRAILEGRKTQTRRIIKARDADPTRCIPLQCLMSNVLEWRCQDGRWFGIEGYDTLVFADCPYGSVGDRLWVRESWAVAPIYDYTKPSEICANILRVPDWPKDKAPCGVRYPANMECVGCIVRPSIHMPRWASRITLEITGVRVERLKDIGEEDAKSEGVVFGTGKPNECRTCARGAFMDLWNCINGPDSWDANPWVWVVEFTKAGG